MAGLRSLLVPLLFFSILQASAQTNQIRVEIEEPGKATTIGAFRHRGNLYASLTDLAALLSLSTYENIAARKLDVKATTGSITVSAANPFVIVADARGRRSTYQLPLPVIYAAGSAFVPLDAFLPLTEAGLGYPAAYDPESSTLRIAAPRTTRAFDITGLRLEPKVNGMLIRIPLARPITEYESWLRNDGWLYVTLADARADIDALNAIRPAGPVKQIVAIQSPTSLQLTFKLARNVASSEIVREEESNDILVSLRTAGTEESVLRQQQQKKVQSALDQQRKRWELDVIVLDAGHGGRDYGAIGVSRTREKDVTLGVTLKLGRLLEQRMKDVKVVYTRKDDSFIELHRRGKIANEADGKLFISIHCNSLRRKPNPTRGFEVYLLRPGRTEEAIEIAERENSVIELEEGYEQRYQELTEENFILVTMAQSAYVKASEHFAGIAQETLEEITDLPNRGVKQAGFYVLIGASMPNILIETAYLSNHDDERFLRSDQGQKKIADALYAAIERYKQDYGKFLLEGRDLGSNQAAGE